MTLGIWESSAFCESAISEPRFPLAALGINIGSRIPRTNSDEFVDLEPSGQALSGGSRERLNASVPEGDQIERLSGDMLFDRTRMKMDSILKGIAHTKRVYDLPYAEEPSRGVTYFDLRKHPEKIDDIPELGDEPLLKALVSILNDPAGYFMTHGCAVARRKPGVEGFPIPVPDTIANALCWFTSYVTFSFWSFDGNKDERYRTIYGMYTPDTNDGLVNFELHSHFYPRQSSDRVGKIRIRMAQPV